ncbi:MAG: DUF808 domain-containing protein [Microbacteriaceae bacterium]|nr:DUF808 domain-containing protein [Microbacteriaceae bacterium]
MTARRTQRADPEGPLVSGLAALLDDIAALVKLTAASLDDVAAAAGRAGAKAAGVVIDDAAVTPQYVSDVDPSRELPIIWRITRGSFVNKLLIILPLLLLLSEFAPWVLPWLLMAGGCYLAYEGAEKLWHMMRPGDHTPTTTAVDRGPDAEKKVIKGAITTDFILSTEIMVIAMNEVAAESLLNRALILIVVAIGITVAVYGAVALIVKMDDVGLSLARRPSPLAQRVGRGLVTAMPGVLAVLSFVGMIAMLWVGGHILLLNTHELGLAQPYGWVHGLAESAGAAVPAVGGLVAWLVETAFSAVFGFVVGTVIMGVLHLLPIRKPDPHAEARPEAAESGAAEPEATESGAAGTGAEPSAARD